MRKNGLLGKADLNGVSTHLQNEPTVQYRLEAVDFNFLFF